MMTHDSVMTSSLCIKNCKIDKFCDFSSDIDYTSKTDVFRDVIYLILNQCEPRRPLGASGRHKVSASRTPQASEARLFSLIVVYVLDIGYSDSAWDRESLVKLSLYPIKLVWNVIAWGTSNRTKLSLYLISTVFLPI